VLAIFATLLAGRVLPFDSAAAAVYWEWVAYRQRRRAPAGMADLQIGAIAHSRGADAIATRNPNDFVGCGVPVIDPWRTT
jgi:predicted nucleic acid-binding protein